MSSQNQRFHCLAENERFAILSLKFLVWSQNSFAFCPKSAVKIPNFSGRQTLVFTSTREKLKTWELTRSLDKSSSRQKSFFLSIVNEKCSRCCPCCMGRAAGDPEPKAFTGAGMAPGGFHGWWQLGMSPRCPCPLCDKSQLSEQQQGVGAVISTPQTLIFVGGHPAHSHGFPSHRGVGFCLFHPWSGSWASTKN